MSSARRPLLTATAAGTLLCALWFVPTANASQDTPARSDVSATRQARVTTTADGTGTLRASRSASRSQVTSRADGTDVSAQFADDTRLADTGSVDTTPYVVGGGLCLAVGAGFVVYSVRRERLGF
ncbi:LAETG motif-containing sortase-dependent surface protein [Streptomyces sp. NPDC047000]|uniref:LAETG motif-containing sortase-dependent surface protein n=1 Tax=Streptomyces sp. NPDC047000 TaxID=3155474 RepID=UPI0033C0D2A4